MPGSEVLSELGRGGMGVVYKARHLKLKRTVALKMVLAGGHGEDDLLARFKAEVEAVARLHHPSILQIYDVNEHNGLPFFSMEFVDGRSPRDKLGGVPLSAAQAAPLLRPLAQAMHHAHQPRL